MTWDVSEYDFTLVAGTTGTGTDWEGLKSTLKETSATGQTAISDLSDSTFHFKTSQASNGSSLTKSSPSSGITVDTASGTVLVSFSVTDTRLFPNGTVLSYELERRKGNLQKTVLMGSIDCITTTLGTQIGD
ncbi:MAG: hypothetical protein HRT36_05460 [Alphaproteobacteria bacterium]|nr:hypothetical protein [Alphaproteobacteria bacterium]